MPRDDMQALTERIERLEDKVEFLLAQTNAVYVHYSRAEKAANEGAVVALLRDGKGKDALKLYREKHLTGFDDAVKAVEALKKQHRL